MDWGGLEEQDLSEGDQMDCAGLDNGGWGKHLGTDDEGTACLPLLGKPFTACAGMWFDIVTWTSSRKGQQHQIISQNRVADAA
jgi:hypothetical protein